MSVGVCNYIVSGYKFSHNDFKKLKLTTREEIELNDSVLLYNDFEDNSFFLGKIIFEGDFIPMFKIMHRDVGEDARECLENLSESVQDKIIKLILLEQNDMESGIFVFTKYS